MTTVVPPGTARPEDKQALRCPRCGCETNEIQEAQRRRTGFCSDRCRLRYALWKFRGTRRARRAHESETGSRIASTYALIAGITICCGFIGLLLFLPCGSSDFEVGLATLILLLAALAGQNAEWTAATFARLVRIPTILFCETRMHLAELVLIVMLLGHGMGMIISYCSLSNAIAVAILLCLLWGLLVFGGAGWGLWVAHVQNHESASQRCALILMGVLSPFALVGVLFGVSFVSCVLPTLPVQPTKAYLSLGGAILLTAVSVYLLRRAHHHHSEATRVLEIRRLEQLRTAAKEQPL